MKKSDVLAWLKENQDERGMAHWKRRGDTPAGMKSHGIGLVKLRKFAKSVGCDAKLAKQLWRSDLIEKQYAKAPVPVPMSIACALMGMGMRTKKLNRAALQVAKQIGPIDFDPEGNCDPYDVVKHLTGDHAKKKLGL